MSNRLWELLDLYWRNEISEEEKAELEQLLLEHPDAWLKSGQLERLSFQKKPVMDEAGAENWAGRVMERIAAEEKETPEPAPRRRKRGRAVWVAACCLLLAAGGVGAFRYFSPGSLKVVTTDAGMKTRIRLPDGSIIWLNAGSTVKYPPQFGRESREVELSGEAFFDVQPDATRPFLIRTEKMNIRVLGTSFNVRAYTDEDFSETSLISGAVEVAVLQPGNARKVLLKPSEKLVVWNAAGTSAKGSATVAGKPERPVIQQTKVSVMDAEDSSMVVETAWLGNHFIFQNETMASLCHRLERWYGTKIIIERPELATLRFSGRADNLELGKLLSVLTEIQPFEYYMQGDTVIIK